MVLTRFRQRQPNFLFVLTLSFWSLAFLAIWWRMLTLQPDGLYAGWIGVWGDWAAHISFVSYFASQNSLPPQFPILAGHVLSYPFAADLVSGILLRSGLDLAGSMILPSIFLSVVLVFSLIWFYKTLLHKPKTVVLAVFLFLLNGGLGFLWFLTDVQKYGLGIIFALPREYTHLSKEANIEWINIVTSEFIPQRGFLLGLPIALFIIGTFWKALEGTKVSRKKLLLGGVMAGSLPLVHMHSLIIVLGFLIWAVFLYTLKYKEKAKIFLWFVVPTVIVALPFIQIFYSHVGSNFLKFQIGWLVGQNNDNLLWFWVKNAGLMLFLPFLGLPLVKRDLGLWLAPSWIIFILANLFLFQPFAWDNTKFFTYWWLGASALAAVFIEKLLSKKLPLKLLGLLLFILATASGGLDVLGITQYAQHKIQMLSTQSLEIGYWARDNTPQNSIFLTADNHDHPITMLSGRRVIRGFPGWLWTYGVDTTDTGNKVQSIYRGDPDARALLSKLDVSFVVVGPWERNIYKEINENFFNQNFPIVFDSGETRIFQVRQN